MKFAVWCDMVIDDLLRGKAEVTITKPEESAVLALPKDLPSALRALADSVELQEKLKAQTVEQAKQIDHLASLMTVNNFLTKHDYQHQTSRNRRYHHQDRLRRPLLPE
ncbi:hypothetical protein [Paludibacterium denitrificans]|uniref:hypothetical protein n=1 Tax=Paludibacterium denitrificans TaxID=2675226 RepID=UPI001E6128CD|nr:hypothetical protein [Paludibacterium denitrificans]